MGVAEELCGSMFKSELPVQCGGRHCRLRGAEGPRIGLGAVLYAEWESHNKALPHLLPAGPSLDSVSLEVLGTTEPEVMGKVDLGPATVAQALDLAPFHSPSIAL